MQNRIILSLCTALQGIDAALLNGDNIYISSCHDSGKQAREIIAVIDDLFKQSGILPHEIDKIALITGPGSFTSLRVGVTAARMFAYSMQKKIVGYDIFAAAKLGYPEHKYFIVDAGKGEFFYSTFLCHPSEGWDPENSVYSNSNIELIENNQKLISEIKLLPQDEVMRLLKDKEFVLLSKNKAEIFAGYNFALCEKNLAIAIAYDAVNRAGEEFHHIKPYYYRPPDAKKHQ